MRLVYVVGQPGAGKTTLVRAAIEHLSWAFAPPTWTFPDDLATVPHEALLAGGVGQDGVAAAHLGAPRPLSPFTGTDTLSMSIAPKALAWLTPAQRHYPVVIGEGDRLGGLKWLTAARAVPGVQLRLLLLDTPDEVSAARRSDRSVALGTPPQNEAWVKGRVTKTRNFRALLEDEGWADTVWSIDGTWAPAYQAEILASHITGP